MCVFLEKARAGVCARSCVYAYCVGVGCRCKEVHVSARACESHAHAQIIFTCCSAGALLFETEL